MKRDEELYRLEYIMKAIDELQDRINMLQARCGDGAHKRAIEFLKSRKSWFFRQFETL